MSTIKVTNIQNPSAASPAIALDTNGAATAQLSSVNGGQLGGFRNLVVNGAMQVSQRTTSEAAVTTTKYSACDRFRFSVNNLGTWTVSQEADGPNGFTASYKQLCTTADASPAAADTLFLAYRLEGYDVQSLAYGTSGAKTTTLSFWVKSNKTGQASLEIASGNGSSRRYLSSYTINAADTWEYKTVVIPGDTDVSAALQADNAVRLSIFWWFNSGADYTGGSIPSSTWGTTSNDQRNYYNLGLGGAINDYIQITGVQLEIGDTATPFERRSYGQELALCQRYYQKYLIFRVPPADSGGGVARRFTAPRTTTMRANPTETGTSGAGVASVTYSGNAAGLYITGNSTAAAAGFDVTNYTADAEL